ncbi:hypothetical protein [Bradyrhizobium sp. USDA 3364]
MLEAAARDSSAISQFASLDRFGRASAKKDRAPAQTEKISALSLTLSPNAMLPMSQGKSSSD